MKTLFNWFLRQCNEIKAMLIMIFATIIFIFGFMLLGYKVFIVIATLMFMFWIYLLILTCLYDWR